MLLLQMLGATSIDDDKKQPAKQETKEDPPMKLLSRSGSDPKFDNIAYLKKVEDNTLAMLKGMGIELD